MRTVKYVPNACKDVEASDGVEAVKAQYEGYVVLRKPNIPEYLDYAESIEAVSRERGDDNSIKNVRVFMPMLDKSKAFYVEVAIKNKETGEEYKSFDDLYADISCLALMIDVASHVAQIAMPEKKQ